MWSGDIFEAIINIVIALWPQFDLHYAIKFFSLFRVQYLSLEMIIDLNNIVRP
jgi:hypothetical protein